MKRFVLPVLLMLAVVSAGMAQSRVSFQLTGGLNYASGGDLARGLKCQSAFLLDEFAAEGELASPLWGFQFAGEFLYHVNDRFALGIGAGYFEHMKQTRASYSVAIIDIQETVTPKYKIIPILANLHYAFPWFGPIKVDLFAGAGLYLAGLDYTYREDFSLLGFNASAIYEFNGSKAGLGVQGGLNLEWVIDPKFSLILSLTGRLASVAGISGDWTDTGSGDFESYFDSGLGHQIWFYKWDSGLQIYDQIVFQEEEPVEDSEISEVRPARLGLSGFTAALGFKIRLF